MARILIIDDEDELRVIMRAALELEGHQIFEARNGGDGLDILRQGPADLIITDIMMPEMDGIETIMALRENNPTVRIIAISGSGPFGTTSLLSIAEKFGATRVLSKPFRRQQLLDTVRATLATAA